MRTYPHVGLVLTGGAARGAYQAGALRAITEITTELGISQPFSVYSGISAGAINAALLASHADELSVGAEKLYSLWDNVSTDQVFRTDMLSLAGIGFRWFLELFSGGLYQSDKARALLDTSPLFELITREISFDKIKQHIDKQLIQSLVITAVNYSDGTNQNFFQTNEPVEVWERVRRRGNPTQITAEHVMASAAIPVFFPPVKVEDSYFGDGSVRNYTPLSPAIKLGAEKLLVITVRREMFGGYKEEAFSPTMGRVISILLNSVLLDAIDIDYERLTRINKTLEQLKPQADTDLKPVDVCMIRPSEDIGKIAFEEAVKMPRTVRYLIKGLGPSKETEGLISYLLFESSYTRRLLKLGYDDAMAQKDTVSTFFRAL